MIKFAIIVCIASSAFCHKNWWSQGLLSTNVQQSGLIWEGHSIHERAHRPHKQPHRSHVNHQNSPNHQRSDVSHPKINNKPNPQRSDVPHPKINNKATQRPKTQEASSKLRAAPPNQRELQGAPKYNVTNNPCTRKIVKPNFKKPGVRISKEKCLDYIWQLKSIEDNRIIDEECTAYKRANNITINKTLFIGGRSAEPGEFPHMIALGWDGVNGGYVFKCGASLISPKFAVTAAHCAISARDPKISNRVPKIVRVGSKSLSPKTLITEMYPSDIKIVKITQHPSYKPPRQYSDIALVELEREVVFDNNVSPACLWNTRDIGNLGAAVSSSGWGVTQVGGKMNPVELQVGDLDIIDANHCDQLLKPKCNHRWCGLEEHQICAGKLAGGVDACQGDSGGPLQSRISLDPKLKVKIYYLLGVTSVGFGCARQNTPGIYTRISSFVDWIEQTVWPNGS